jgi:hypothetical protein
MLSHPDTIRQAAVHPRQDGQLAADRRRAMTALGHTTYLSPGQRYVPNGSAGWRPDRQLTVLLVSRDSQGLPRVAYRSANGRRIVEPAAEFEAAVTNGQIVPVTDAGSIGLC